MNNFTCAVIGSKGYIGSHIVGYLRSIGIRPLCYDVVDCSDIDYCMVDLTKIEELSKIDFSVDYIFLFAGLTGTYAGFDNAEKYIVINELGLANLLNAIRESKYRPKVIFPSSRLVYKGSDRPLREDDSKETKTIYAVNKLACEGLLNAYYQSFDIPYTVFRICIPYGNFVSNDYSFGTIGFFLRQAKSGKNITLYGGGNIKRTFTHIKDICHQIVECSLQRESDGEIYNIGGETMSLYEAATIIANKYNVEVVATEWPYRDLRIESGHTYFDDSKIKSLISIDCYKSIKDFTQDL